jgi:hypothetical protein
MEDTISSEKYSELLQLQEAINDDLKDLYETNKERGREHLSQLLINEIESLVDRLNSKGWNFGRCNYGGDINFENSEQSYSDGEEMGTGVILNFVGFSCQVTWEGKDRFKKF